MKRSQWFACVVALGALCGCGTKSESTPHAVALPLPPPPSGCALAIPAEGARATVMNTDGLFGSAFTLEFWLRFDGADLDFADPATFPPHRVAAVHSATDDAWFSVAIDMASNHGIICTLASQSGSLLAMHDLPTPPHSWHAIACELDEDGVGLWYDGELVWWDRVQPGFTGYPAQYTHDGSPLVLGQGDGASPREEPPQSTFAGAIDEVRVSNVALYDPRFSDDWRFSDGDSYTPERAAVVTDSTSALWHFDECSGDTAVDSGPDGRNAVLDNGASWLAPASAATDSP